MKRHLLPATCLAVAALILAPVAGAGWTSYWGPGTFRKPPASPQAATSGSNYWTSQRVYRPTGHPFYLYYNNGSSHYSTDNSTDNPFTWIASGYGFVGCFWDYGIDGSSTVDPVTCQAFA